MKYGFVVPVYNHGSALESVVKNIEGYNFPIIVVDDGNDEVNKNAIAEVVKNCPLCVLVTREKNGGKGKALADGVRKADELGLSHVLQIDSDGQHDAERVAHFVEVSMKNPDAIICAYPEYDESAPKHRVNGRAIANGWIHFVTLSNEIKDGMIGFRIYPVAPYIKLLNSPEVVDSRMGYDIEVLVRLFWRNVPVISESVKVTYPVDGVSNFRVVRDNIRISLTYTRLCLGMIVRLPVLIYRKIRKGNEK